MRGEETQLAGILPLFASGRHLICMPGTHSKWVDAADGVISGFQTWLTGELFSVLSKQSILRHSLGESAAPALPENPVFLAACGNALGKAATSAQRSSASALRRCCTISSPTKPRPRFPAC